MGRSNESQLFWSSGVNFLGKYPTVSTYHTTGHFQRKTKRCTN